MPAARTLVTDHRKFCDISAATIRHNSGSSGRYSRRKRDRTRLDRCSCTWSHYSRATTEAFRSCIGNHSAGCERTTNAVANVT